MPGKMKFNGFVLNDSQKIYVSKNEEDKREYISSIESINEDAITITRPLHKQDAMPLRRGEDIYVKIIM
ncbi:MAG: flagellar brake domain-containing protein, partial [Peptococcaceae bacterium]|nr:flagellar brake domain-containing protein [Peptococcaceae bacterium]